MMGSPRPDSESKSSNRRVNSGSEREIDLPRVTEQVGRQREPEVMIDQNTGTIFCISLPMLPRTAQSRFMELFTEVKIQGMGS